MPELSRAQLLVYAVIAIAVLVIGARWIRSADSGSTGGDGISFAADSSRDPGGGGDVVVHVAGGVSHPGVYRLPAGSRVTDAVRRAGGFARAANRDAINLAARLADGQQVVVPSRAPGGAATASEDGPISLGSADQADLETIDGIGPATIEFLSERLQP